MNKQLKALLGGILEECNSLCLDNQEDKEKMINILAEGLTPDDYSEVVTISEAIFPNGEVDETMMTCELMISTGLYNVAAAGDEPHLVEENHRDYPKPTQAGSGKFFPDYNTTPVDLGYIKDD